MPLQKLSKEDLAADPDYVRFLRELEVGEGGRATVEGEGIGKVSIKKRLQQASEAADIPIDFIRSDPATVIFERVAD